MVTPSRPSRRIPVSLLAAGVLAYVALGATLGGSWLLPVLALAGVAGAFSSPRLAAGGWTPWFWRAALLTAALLDPESRSASGADTFIDARTGGILGVLAAGELTLQLWTKRPVFPLSRAVFLVCVVFLAGAHTIDLDLPQYLTPPFIALLLLSARCEGTAPGSRPSWRIETIRGIYIAMAVLCGVSFFLPLWIWRKDITLWTNDLLFGRQQRAGFSSMPSLDSSFGLRDSLTRVARIDTRMLPRRRAPGPGFDLEHLRAAVFPVYSRGLWGAAIHRRAYQPAGWLNRIPEGAYPLEISRYEGTGWVFPTYLGTQGAVVQGDMELAWDPAGGGTLRTSTREPVTIRVGLDPSGNRSGPLSEAFPEEVRWQYLSVRRDLDPKIRDIAAAIERQALRGPLLGRQRSEVLSDAVVRYLQANHNYSLEIRVGAGDPVSNFLLLRKDGHCEFFASAAALLLRCMRIPTRYVSGFYVHEVQEPGVYIARQRDAHAWAEAWVEGKGWITVEATPPDGRPEALRQPPWWLQTWELALDQFLRGFSALRGEDLVWVLAALVAGFGGYQILVAVRRRLRPATAPAGLSPDPAGPLATRAQQFDRILQALNAPCPPGRPWSEHLNRIPPERLNGERLQLEEFVAGYNALRFGSPAEADATPERLRRMDELLASLRAASRRS